MEIVFVIRICYNELQNTYKKCKFMTVSYKQWKTFYRSSNKIKIRREIS